MYMEVNRNFELFNMFFRFFVLALHVVSRSFIHYLITVEKINVVLMPRPNSRNTRWRIS